MTGRVAASVLVVAFVAGCRADTESDPAGFSLRAGEDSLKFNPAIGDDERRGEAPGARPAELKREIAGLLKMLRTDGKGLKPQTEFHIESYFTVADAFEADGLLEQAVDGLHDLEHKLHALVDARAGRHDPDSLIETEHDLLHYRDAHNIHGMDGKYLTGAQPTEKGYRWLKSKGVTTVINLRLPSDHERKILDRLELEYVHIPWPDEQPPSPEQVRQMLAAVESAEGRVFQHCLRGIGRDMTMAGCYMIANHGQSAETFIENGRKQAPRWESDQKRDGKTGQPVQFQLLREFEKEWKATREAK
ncbi:MAG: dual specificity protein phosphatase family protein [Planctomycetes bacterium]|nr:dual specificity protein phosphatase family protein [Planctomycetota bacterium]